MAVTFAIKRSHATTDTTTYSEFCAATLTGTYVTGGFTWNPFNVFGAGGSSPLASSTVLTFEWYSPLGYIYSTTLSGNVATTKILSAANTELANAAAVPDASLAVTLRKRKI